MTTELHILARKALEISEESEKLAGKIKDTAITLAQGGEAAPDHFLPLLTIFVLACFVGYYVVWKVTPALHTPLMAVTNAISGIIVIGALLAIGFEDLTVSTIFGVGAIFLAAINIFGGFVVTVRMLAMFKKK